MKRYKVKFDEGKTKGVFAMSVVENPAMESAFIALKETPINFAEVDPSRKILLGAALIPDKPIYRNDANGEYELIFDSQTIEKAAHNFVKAGYVNNATEEHKVKLSGESVSVVESWIKEDEAHDKSLKFGLNEPVGTWFIMMKVNDEELYNKAKDGKIKGFSIEGLFETELILNSNKQMEVKSITEAISEGFKDIKAFFTSEPVAEPVATAEPAQATTEPAATEPVAEPTQEVNLAEVLKTEFLALSTLLSEKFTAMETKFAEQEKTIEAQEAKIVELSKEPASKPVRAKATAVDLSKMTKRERILFNLQNAN
jgi:uncharacterized coiled-coil protein SlyX